eukprot:2271142-Amphidinium_carterae.1
MARRPPLEYIRKNEWMPQAYSPDSIGRSPSAESRCRCSTRAPGLPPASIAAYTPSCGLSLCCLHSFSSDLLESGSAICATLLSVACMAIHTLVRHIAGIPQLDTTKERAIIFRVELPTASKADVQRGRCIALTVASR